MRVDSKKSVKEAEERCHFIKYVSEGFFYVWFFVVDFYLLWYQFPVTSSVQLSLQYQTLYCEY